MSSYHEDVKRILGEVHKFLSVTINSEKLSQPVLKEKNRVLEALLKVWGDHPSIAAVSADEGSVSSITLSVPDESRSTASSGEEDYTDNIPDTTVKSLNQEATKMGYLDRKQKGLLRSTWQKQYCVLHKGVFYCFLKPADSKQKGAFFVVDYKLEKAPQNVKDASKKDASFELVSPGKKTYQFCAENQQDLEAWKQAIEGCLESKEQIEEIPVEDDVYEPFDESTDKQPNLTQPRQPSPVEDGDEIYEFVEPPPETKDTVKKTSENIENQNQTSPEITSPQPTSPRSLPPTPPSASLPPMPSRPVPSIPVVKSASEAPPNLPPATRRVPPPPPAGSSIPPALPSRNIPPPPKKPLPSPPPEAKPTNQRVLTLDPLCHPPEDDYENLYFGAWASKASTSNELSFERGDLVHIISRQLETEGWWVGAKNGKVGLVPKAFMLPAFQALP